MAEGTSN